MEKPWVKELKWVLEDLEDDPRKDVCRPSSRTNVKEIYITADNQESPKVKKRTKQKSEKSFPHSSRSRAVMTPVVPIAPGELESPGTSDDEEATAWKERVSSARERHEQARAMADTFTEKFHSILEDLEEMKIPRKSSTRLRSSCSQSANEYGSPLASTQSDKALRRDWLQHMITAGEAGGDIIRTSSSASLSLPTIYEVVKGSSESKPDVSGDDVKKSKKSKCKVRQGFHHFTKALTGLLVSKLCFFVFLYWFFFCVWYKTLTVCVIGNVRRNNHTSFPSVLCFCWSTVQYSPKTLQYRGLLIESL